MCYEYLKKRWIELWTDKHKPNFLQIYYTCITFVSWKIFLWFHLNVCLWLWLCPKSFDMPLI